MVRSGEETQDIKQHVLKNCFSPQLSKNFI